MKGDFSRDSFRPEKKYTSVRMQQGRVILDADWNEWVDMVTQQQAQAAEQIVGNHGGLGDSFKIDIAQRETEPNEGQGETATPTSLPHLVLTAGQYYVNGVLCQLDETVPLTQQPLFPGATAHFEAMLADDFGHGLLYLEAWERHITPIEDPALKEPALDGIDTTTRTQTVWQVKLLPLAEEPEAQTAVSEHPAWQALTAVRQPELMLTPSRPTENELYRIEIHEGPDSEGKLTWKWSRDNGTIVFPLQGLDTPETDSDEAKTAATATLTAEPRLKDQLRNGDWVELSCDQWELNGRSGLLGQIQSIAEPQDGKQEIEVALVEALDNANFAPLQEQNQHPWLRRWDQTGVATPTEEGTIAPILLESGTTITFAQINNLQRGDYWLAPIREGINDAMQIPRTGPNAIWAPLALLAKSDDNWQLTDQRRPFQNLGEVFTELTTLRDNLHRAQDDLVTLQETTTQENEARKEQIALLQEETTTLRQILDQLAVRELARSLRTYRAKEPLEIGEVVGASPTEDGLITRATLDVMPIGVVVPAPEGFAREEYNIQLSGPVLCRAVGNVAAGDLLAISSEPGSLEKASFWTRLFWPKRLIARAIDVRTTPEHSLIFVYLMAQ